METLTIFMTKNAALFKLIENKKCRFIKDCMKFKVWRAPTDNDRKIKLEWIEAGFNNLESRVYKTTIENKQNYIKNYKLYEFNTYIS